MAIAPKRRFFNPPPEPVARSKDQKRGSANATNQAEDFKNAKCDQGLHDGKMDNVYAIADVAPPRRI